MSMPTLELVMRYDDNKGGRVEVSHEMYAMSADGDQRDRERLIVQVDEITVYARNEMLKYLSRTEETNS